MNKQKRFWVSFLVLASILLMTSFASATSGVNFTSIKVNGIETYAFNNNVAVLAGNTIPVTVTFNASSDESNVRMSVELQGVKNDISKEILVGDIEAGKIYIRSLALRVPSDMIDVKSDDINLVINMWNKDFSQTTPRVIHLRQQRQTYNIQFMSLSTVSSVNAGNLLPVDVVLKNIGYNRLNDLSVVVSIPALNIQRTAYFGDLAIAGNNDTISGRVFLQVPYNASTGSYTVQAEVRNTDLVETAVRSVTINNEFQSNVVVSNSEMNSKLGQITTYNLVIVNPTNNIQLYKIVPQTVSGVTISTDSLVTIPAGSSKTVTLTAKADSAGDHNFSVNVFSGSQLTGSVSLALSTKAGVSNPIAVLTIVLTIIFVVLLVVLIVLVTKKPKKQEEEFSESYY